MKGGRRKAEGGPASGRWPAQHSASNLNLPSPFGRGAGGEGLDDAYRWGQPFFAICPRPNPIPRGEGTDTTFSALRRLRSAFTLTELLVTITIISILAAMVLGAVHAAGEAGKEYATKATIAKLNDIIMERYESYMTRRVPIQIPVGTTPYNAAVLRLRGVRELMRMEMPERWSDIINPALSTDSNQPDPDGLVPIEDSAGTVQANLSRPALSRLYAQRYTQVKAFLTSKGITDNRLAENAGPECLYLIVSVGAPETLEQFNTSEIGDVDEDTLPEFLDGWGHPISFLRWAPGFNNSDVQPNIINWNVDPNSERTFARNNDHDPFDPRRVDQTDPIAPHLPTGWRLVPLIYSIGPDGIDGLIAGANYNYRGNPYETLSTPTVGIGAPSPTGNGEHLDNITNHHIEQR